MSKEDVRLIKDMAEQVERMETLTGHTKDLVGELNDAAKVFNKLSKATAVLGIVGIGFDIVLSLFDSGPSPEEEILKAVDALSTKVDVLWKRLEGKFEDLEVKNNLRSAKSGVREEISALRTLGQSVQSRNIDELRQLGTFEIRKWVNNLADHARGSALHQNIFKAVYESTQGSPDQMYYVGAAMVDSAIVALIATGMIQADQWRAEQRSTPSSVDKQVTPSAKQRKEQDSKVESALWPAVKCICDEFATWQQRCVVEADANIGKVFDTLLSNLDNLKGRGVSGASYHISTEANYRSVAETILVELRLNWGSYDWLVIVGQPTREESKNFDWAVSGKDIIYRVNLNYHNFNGMRSSVLIAAQFKKRNATSGSRPFAQIVKDIADDYERSAASFLANDFSGILWFFRKGVNLGAAWSDPVGVEVGIVTSLRDGKSGGRVHWEEPKAGWDALLWGAQVVR